MMRDIGDERARGGITAAAALDRLVNQYPGPALIVGPGGRIVGANEAARVLSAMLRAGHDGLARLVDRSRLSVQGLKEELVFQGEDEDDLVLEVTALAMGAMVLLLARDTTVERRLIVSLSDSRQRLTDIIDCLPDFSWETDSRGTLTFVAPRLALGYPAEELHGQDAAVLIDAEWLAGRANPFRAEQRLTDSEVWLRAKDGTHLCARLSCVPVCDDHGRQIGVRGVARDITAARARENALSLALDRERLRGAVTEAMRGAGGLERALRVAAEAPLSALNAGGALILARNDAGGVANVLMTGSVLPVTAWSIREEVARLMARDTMPGAVHVVELGTDTALVAIAWESGAPIGALVLVRSARQPWQGGQISLLGAVADQLGLVLGLRARVAQLEALSLVDALTGVMNRRAFDQELATKMRQADRLGRRGTLLLIDFDGFKALNDRFGHAYGDRALSLFGRAIQDNLRAGDLAARLGGDEFALWLDGADAAGGFAKTDSLYEMMGRVNGALGSPEAALGLSIGIAVYEPGGGEGRDAITSRADHALYRAKRGGRNRAELALTAGSVAC
ncbi:diguanylate cyclase [Oleomonas cavernae]|nr:diguanylate cyclase [Oleomonas cavernae]